MQTKCVCDINTRNPEYLNVQKEIWDSIPNAPPPDICTSFSPIDNAKFMQVLSVVYLTKRDVNINILLCNNQP